MTITRRRHGPRWNHGPLVPIELDNGAKVVCKHDMLAINQTGLGRWVHIHNRQYLCRPAYGGRPAGPYVAEPYILP